MPDIKSQRVFDSHTDVSLNPHKRALNSSRSNDTLSQNLQSSSSIFRDSSCPSSLISCISATQLDHASTFPVSSTCPESKIEAFVLRASSGTRNQRELRVGLFLNTSFKGTVFVSSHQTSLLLLHRLRPENFYTFKA
jgi:hypothetical protein